MKHEAANPAEGAPYGTLPAPLHDHALLPWRFFALFQAADSVRAG